MTFILTIISKILPIIFLILLGSAFCKFKFIKENSINDIKKIVVNICLPLMLFITFSQTKLEFKYLYIVISVFIACIVMLFIGKLIQMTFKIDNKYFPTLFSGFETGMIGYSIFTAVYGTANMYKLAIIDLGQVIFVFFVLVSYLNKLNGKSLSYKDLIISFIKSPIIISVIFGIIGNNIGIIHILESFSISNAVFETIKIISSLTIPLICIALGYELKINFKKIKFPLVISVTRISILFLLAFIINQLILINLLHLDKIFTIALYTMFLLPPPFIIPIFMKTSQEEHKQTVLNTISINIVLSIITYIILIVIL